MSAQIISFSGAVEIAPSLGKADLICDLVSSGSTLRAHQLYEAETILESRASLIQTPVAIRDDKAQWLQRLLQRIQGVLQVKESKYIMLHAPRSALEGDPRAAARQRVADDHSARGPRRQGRGARRVPRERVLGDARAAQRGRRELDARAAGREDARRSAPCASKSGKTSRPRAVARVLARPALANDATLRDARRCDHRARAAAKATPPCSTSRRSSTVSSSRRSKSDERNSRRAGDRLSDAQRAAIRAAAANIESVSRAAATRAAGVDTAPGVRCERVWRPIESVGLYVPAGNAPLPSTALMLGVPARLAGCPTRLAVQPRAGGRPRRPGRALCGARERRAARVQARRRTGDRGARLRHRDGTEGRQGLRPRQRLGDRGQGASRSGSVPGPRATIRPARPRCS